MNTATASGAIGFGDFLIDNGTTQDFELGTRLTAADGKEYMYVIAGATHVADERCAVDATFTTADDVSGEWAATVGVASGDYLWVYEFQSSPGGP